MLDKQAKKRVNEVVDKYTGMRGANKRALGFLGAIFATVGATAANTLSHKSPADMLIGAGIGAGGGIAVMLFAQRIADPLETANAAGQGINCTLEVARTLEAMESRLKIAFAEAAVPNAPAKSRAQFLSLAKEVMADVSSLSPAFKIASGGPNGFSGDRLTFVVGERVIAPGIRELVPLEKAVAGLMPQPYSR
jgi:hypothetical protein